MEPVVPLSTLGFAAVLGVPVGCVRVMVLETLHQLVIAVPGFASLFPRNESGNIGAIIGCRGRVGRRMLMQNLIWKRSGSEDSSLKSESTDPRLHAA